MKISRLLLPAGVAGLTALVLVPSQPLRGFSTIGGSLPLSERQFRIFNNFSDVQANDNQTPHPDIAGGVGAFMSIRKGAYEWNNRTFASGTSDPLQSLGSGDADFDFYYMGEVLGFGGGEGNRCAALPGDGNGVLAFMDPGAGTVADGYNIRFYDGDIVWEDSPTGAGGGEFDLQSVACHEFGHALGLGHTNVGGSTMWPSIGSGSESQRSIASDDIAGVQFLYGVRSASKPTISSVTTNGSQITITGTGFDATDNDVWFTKETPAGKPQLMVLGVASTNGGTEITVTAPIGATDGDLAVRIPGNGGDKLSDVFPVTIDDTGVGPPTFYCLGKLSSAICLAQLTTSDTSQNPVSGANDYDLIANGVQELKNGLFFGSISGPDNAPFSGGTLCVSPPTFRTPIQNSGGVDPNGCNGQMILTVNTGVLIPFGPDAGPGNMSWMQLWYRDPNNGAGTLGTALSDAVEFTFQ